MNRRKTIDLGSFLITHVSGGVNRLDGGCMMGVVPQKIWRKWLPPDEENRIALETHCLVVEGNDGKILIESGCGNKLDDKERDFFGVEAGDWIVPHLLEAGHDPNSFKWVCLSHLHTDHSGGVVAKSEDGTSVPTFPNAEVLVSRIELEDAHNGYGITPNAYNPHNTETLLENRMLRAVEFNGETIPGISFLHTPGHTRGHSSILIRGEKGTLAFTGDLLPLAQHATPHFNMALEVDPMLKMKTKRNFLNQAAEEEWIIVLSHEPDTPVMRAFRNREKGRVELKPE